jgi:polysaccharide biosynthesis/export protein
VNVDYRSIILVAILAAPSLAQSAPTEQQTSPQTPPAAGIQVDPDYVIGTDDVLGVMFWREPELSGDVTVRPDGKITVPVVGELGAAGLTPDALKKVLQAAAGKYVNEPNVQVVVRTINSRKVFVTGRVVNPGTYPINRPLTVIQAIALAGGLTEYADAKNVSVLRTTPTGTQSFKFNYKDVSRGKNLAQNIPLMPGDTIIVP